MQNIHEAERTIAQTLFDAAPMKSALGHFADSASDNIGKSVRFLENYISKERLGKFVSMQTVTRALSHDIPLLGRNTA